MRKIGKFFTITISIVLVLSAVAIALLAFPVFGNQALIVRSGSMEPNIGVGSVVVVREAENVSSQENLYNTGDVIAFRHDANTVITHRVVDVETSGSQVLYQTKGDANEEIDNWTVAQSDVIGKNLVTIPHMGKVLTFARSDIGFPLLIIFPAALVILFELTTIIREIRKYYRKKNEENVSQNKNNNRSYVSQISPDSYFTKKNFYALKILIPLIALGFFIQSTQAFFSDTETSTGNYFQAASEFPTSPTPTPSVSPTPTDDPDEESLCSDINVDISGNGAGSVNGVFIICQNHEVVFQSNETNVNTDINIDSNTGNNSNSGNTGSSSATTTGNSSTNVNVEVSGGENSINSPTPTL